MKKSGLTIRVDNANKVWTALKKLGDRDVLVGIPAEKSERDDASFSNAGIGYLNEMGSPAKNIPPRPHLQPGVRSVNDNIVLQLKNAAKALFDGKQESAEKGLNRAGQIAVQGVQRYLSQADFVPLSDVTIQKRAMRKSGKRKGALKEQERRLEGGDRFAKTDDGTQYISNMNARPLIDTGIYRRSITYVVRNRRK